MEQKRYAALRVTLLSAVTACAMAISALAANTGVITGDVVNTRTGPGTGYERVELLAKGKKVTILGDVGDWYHIQWGDSKGYVAKEYVAASGGAAQTKAADATVTGGSTINVRSGPGTEHSRIGMVASGKRMAILGQENGWYHVSYDGTTGYILADYLIPDAKAQAPAPVEEPPAVEEPGSNATVTGGNINVRSGPATSFGKVATLGTGRRVTVLAEEAGWFKISFSGNTGYILGDYCVPDGGVLDALLAAEAAEAAVEAPAGAEEAPAVPVATAEAISVESVGVAPPAQEGDSRPGVITGGTINVRSGPGTGYERVAQVSTGKRVTILGDENGWAHISFGSTSGYVLGDYIIEGDTLPESSIGDQVAALAATFLGVPYRYGGSSPSGFDCSGFTMYLYRQFGYNLPHTASGQYATVGYKISQSELKPGDLVFFSSNGSGGSINHAGVYVGNGQVIHARYSVGKVYTNSLSESYYARNYVGAVRVVGSK